MEKGRILLVDDDADLLRLLSLRMKAAGYVVSTAASGSEALSVLAMEHPSLVITDLKMDEMDGMALLDAIRRDYPTLPVIILTAHGSIPDALLAADQGVFAFLTKPFDGKDLMAQVERAFNLTAAVPPSSGKKGRDSSWDRILTRSPKMQTVLDQARLVAASDASVFIHGASGTGKELLAQAIHQASPRHGHAFIAVNCAAFPEQLLESELFGHKKGAFTGAASSHQGLFQAAEGGTLFLDEIGDMPLPLQVKLLRALQERMIRPVGATESIAVDVRIISASHRDLEQEMAARRFRDDLYYRLCVVTLELPALAERPEDIPLLAEFFLRDAAAKNRKDVRGIAPEAMELLVSAPWPGNVRQLANVIEQAVVLSTTPRIGAPLIRHALRDREGEVMPLADAKGRFEMNYLIQIMRMTRGNVSQAAQLAQRNRTEFYRLLHRYHLDPAAFKEAGGEAEEE
ncbi:MULTISPECIES: sigma 54-interacting transcriptional regulator [Acidithiobacillus]|jgi:two-component system response regulator GlrR|uniref:Sigma-54 dependent DNA-binding response regulator, putative n=2 Tax=Acidithiobacillus ferrooxidans TaxID=920 RepID=B7J9S8_ACIF2|nr:MULTISPECIES: sigma 54-interacting transcriptional regulator [Acidithiobacillus]MCL5957614.1 sigma 54-interacting transcriptional regulator [Gammaproteobacteria bacterium]ACH84762.1 two component, sigma54 specific, transcriptional regulator, Fis family [Acidithiobacillus ferrooxidans ATCC 53993]ACK78896.1 sigma-54 dependent DNA-binding response regulator, putative [Acidithiobacillus ferrooxidans ATCC 23270]MBN6745667.1 sigma 54-interacting transcriptional regulator [Acidithiobacillus sp. MC2